MSSASDRSLHCISSAPDSSAAHRLLAHLQQHDPVLLCGKAVTLGGKSHSAISEWLDTGAVIHALEEDLRAYAIRDLHPSIIVTDYAGWVKLSETYATQVLWR